MMATKLETGPTFQPSVWSVNLGDKMESFITSCQGTCSRTIDCFAMVNIWLGTWPELKARYCKAREELLFMWFYYSCVGRGQGFRGGIARPPLS